MKNNRLILSLALITLLVMSNFAIAQGVSDGDTNCLHLNCNKSGEDDRPAVIFGINDRGLGLVGEVLQENSDLVQKVIAHELTIKDGKTPTKIGALIEKIVNKDFPVVDNVEFDPPFAIAGAALALDPESFTTETANEVKLTEVNFLENPKYLEDLNKSRIACEKRYQNNTKKRKAECSTYKKTSVGGLGITDFNLYDLKVNYNLKEPRPSVKICGKFNINVTTDLGIGVDILSEDIRVNNINIDIKNGKEHCFQAGININDFSLTGIKRVSKGKVVERSELDKALRNPNLTYTVPGDHVLSSLSNEEFNAVAADTLAPILSNDTIQSSIEAPIVDVIQTLIESQISKYTKDFLSNDLPSPISNTSVDIPEVKLASVHSSFQSAVDILSDECTKKKKIQNAIDSMEWLVKENPEFSIKEKINQIDCFDQLTQDQKDQIRGVTKILDKRRNLKEAKDDQSSTARIINLLNEVPVDGANISTYAPELCLSQGVASEIAHEKSAIQNFASRCGGAYALLSVEAVNKVLEKPEIHRALCSGTKEYKKVGDKVTGCAFKVVDFDKGQSYADEKVTLNCDNFNPLKATVNHEGATYSPDGDLSLTLKAKLEECRTKVLPKTALKHSALNLYMKAKVESHGCAKDKPFCIKLGLNHVWRQKSQLPWIPDFVEKGWNNYVVNKFKEKIESETLPELEEKINEVLFEKIPKGFKVDSKFQVGANLKNPGVIGVCLSPTAKSEAFKKNLCSYAQKAYGEDHIVSAECSSSE